MTGTIVAIGATEFVADQYNCTLVLVRVTIVNDKLTGHTNSSTHSDLHRIPSVALLHHV